MSTRTKVVELIVGELGVEPSKVTDDAELVVDLGMDSLDTVELFMAAEEEFGIEVHDEEAEQVQNVGDFVALVDRALARPTPRYR